MTVALAVSFTATNTPNQSGHTNVFANWSPGNCQPVSKAVGQSHCYLFFPLHSIPATQCIKLNKLSFESHDWGNMSHVCEYTQKRTLKKDMQCL